jgi:hypothetical protein
MHSSWSMRLIPSKFLRTKHLTARNFPCPKSWSGGSFAREYHVTKSLQFMNFSKDFTENLHQVIESTKGTIFGLMAKSMNEKDVKRFLNHWEHLLPGDGSPSSPFTGQREELVSSAQEQAPSSASRSPPSVPSASSNYDNVFTNRDVTLYHPLLGELLLDYGYKRIYSTSVSAIARTPVWRKQRILRLERAEQIAQDKIRKGITAELPGIITLYEDVKTKEIAIIDGQHRAAAMMILAQRGYWNETENNILVEVFPVDQEEDIKLLFRIINAAEPVRLIDMPDNQMIQEKDEDVDEVEEPVITADQKRTTKFSSVNQSGFSAQGDGAQIQNPSSPHSPALTVSGPGTSVSESGDRKSAKEMVDHASSSSLQKSSSEILDKPVCEPPERNSRNKAPSSALKSENDAKKQKQADPAKQLTPQEMNEFITVAADKLSKDFPEMFKPSSRCKMPHLNIDIFRDDLFSNNFLQLNKITAKDQLMEILLGVNEQLKLKYSEVQDGGDEESQQSYSKSFQTALAKAQKFDFYLGMEKQWMFVPFASSRNKTK